MGRVAGEERRHGLVSMLVLAMKSPLRVFVIEDSPILLERIAEAIADQPSLILVGTADSEKDALTKIKALKPEVLVVDIKLREGNGLSYPAVVRDQLRITLSTGVEALLLAERDNGWVQIQLADGTVGWTPTESVYLLR